MISIVIVIGSMVATRTQLRFQNVVNWGPLHFHTSDLTTANAPSSLLVGIVEQHSRIAGSKSGRCPTRLRIFLVESLPFSVMDPIDVLEH